VFYVGYEDSAEQVIRPVVVEALGGDPARFHLIDALEVTTRAGDRKESLFTLSADGLEALDAAMARYRPVLMAIDPITGHLGGADSFKDAEVRERLMPLAKLAQQYGTAIVGIGHMTKDQQRAVAYRVGGSIAFYAVARAVFFVVQDPDDPRRRAFFHEKGNLAELTAARAFSIVPHYVDERIGSVGIPAWDPAPVDYTLEDALRVAGGSQEHRQQRESVPQAVLRSILLTRGGRAPSEEVYAVAETMGVKRRTLERAKERLGVLSHRAGFGPGSTSYWCLPAFAPTAAE
jgi:AAA domain